MVAKSLYEWFTQSVDRHPDEIALEVADRSLTYSALDHLVDRIAGGVTDAHGGTPQAIGLLAARSLTAFAGYLAALRLGTVIVPLNPAFPAARNLTMCQAAGVDLVIAGEEAGDDISGSLPAEVATVVRLTRDGLERELAAPAAEGLDPHVPDLDAVAYIVFTSGSTGIPKGVPIVHRNLDAYIAGQIERYEAGPGSRFSQTFELTFDPTLFDMFVPWGSGGTLVVPSMDELRSPVDYVNRRQLTHWFSAPSTVSVTRRMGALTAGCMPSLRWSRFSGEQLTLRQAADWSDAAPSTVIENVYGPTELTMTCSGYRLPADRAHWPATANDTVPIGQVYPYLESVILDAGGRPALDGELCVRGCQRFPGYLDPRSNAGRFMVHDGAGAATVYDGTQPLTERHWYRTGDRIVVVDDYLVHLGRLDDQVKLRGYRVELGEVETVLNRHPSVDQAAAVTVVNDAVHDLAVAYTGQRLHPRELIAFIRESLPGYMTPSRFFHVSELPLNVNGKIDRHQIRKEIQEKWLR